MWMDFETFPVIFYLSWIFKERPVICIFGVCTCVFGTISYMLQSHERVIFMP